MKPPAVRLPRLPPTEQLILTLLMRGEHYGLELVSASDGRLKRGTIYVTLGRMETKGYITSRLEAQVPSHGGLRRRLYLPTPYGRRLLAAWAAMMTQLIPEFGQ